MKHSLGIQEIEFFGKGKVLKILIYSTKIIIDSCIDFLQMMDRYLDFRSQLNQYKLY